MEPGCLVIVDSTGLKRYDKDAWHPEKHDVAARRMWRKLHLAVDENHQGLACELTTPETGDPRRCQICWPKSIGLSTPSLPVTRIYADYHDNDKPAKK